MNFWNFDKKILSPFFAGIFVVISMLAYYLICYLFHFKFGFFDIEATGVTETLTYLFYGFTIGVICCFAKDFINTPHQNTFCAIVFLLIAALFREMGIQHWLTTHDTVITKTRFFTNPNNPLYEKLIAGFLMLLVLVVFVWVLCKCFKKLIQGIVKFNPICWTTLTFALLAFITQIVDRFPANYYKSTGVDLSDPVLFVLKILEEGGESLLPLLFALAFVQYHFLKKEG